MLTGRKNTTTRLLFQGWEQVTGSMTSLPYDDRPWAVVGYLQWMAELLLKYPCCIGVVAAVSAWGV
jgi:hypothetical protein